jgi:hypothetical protein
MKAKFFHCILFVLNRKRLNNPVHEMHRSKGKKDQFHATAIGLE